jgi:hypothetical protein
MQAEQFAARIEKEAGDDAVSRIRTAYALALSRPPTDNEISAARQFVQQGKGNGAWVDFCQVLFGLNEFAYVD